MRCCGLPPEWHAAPAGCGSGCGAGALALAGLAAVASVLLVVALVTGAPRIVAAYGALAPTFGDGLGVTLLGLAYLPNAAVGALSWAVGAGFTVGTATISPFDAKPGVPSSFPLLAALPTGVPPVWAPAVLALPVLLGMLVGLSVRRALPVPADRIRATVVAGLVAALGGTLLALLAGGRLAAGPYDPVRFPPELIAPATLLWIGGIAAVVVILRRPVDDPVYVEVVDGDREPEADTGGGSRACGARRPSGDDADDVADVAPGGARTRPMIRRITARWAEERWTDDAGATTLVDDDVVDVDEPMDDAAGDPRHRWATRSPGGRRRGGRPVAAEAAALGAAAGGDPAARRLPRRTPTPPARRFRRGRSADGRPRRRRPPDTRRRPAHRRRPRRGAGARQTPRNGRARPSGAGDLRGRVRCASVVPAAPVCALRYAESCARTRVVTCVGLCGRGDGRGRCDPARNLGCEAVPTSP